MRKRLLTVTTTGQCHVKADTKQGIFQQMEQFLDEQPHTYALARDVHRAGKKCPFAWQGMMRWERVLRVSRSRKHASGT